MRFAERLHSVCRHAELPRPIEAQKTLSRNQVEKRSSPSHAKWSVMDNKFTCATRTAPMRSSSRRQTFAMTRTMTATASLMKTSHVTLSACRQIYSRSSMRPRHRRLPRGWGRYECQNTTSLHCVAELDGRPITEAPAPSVTEDFCSVDDTPANQGTSIDDLRRKSRRRPAMLHLPEHGRRGR